MTGRSSDPRLLVAIAMVVLLLPLSGGSARAGQGGSQILRPLDEASSILEAERVARLTVLLPVDAQTAFDAWTDATRMVEWLSHWAEMTVDVGAGFQIGWEGYEGIWQGQYLEIQRPRLLKFTWLPPAEVFPAGAYETIVTLTFEPADQGGTRMTLEHTGFRAGPELDAQLQAWRGYLFALRAYLLQPTLAR